MTTEIYFFSGTGNSFSVAGDIAVKTAGKLIPIGSIIKNETIHPDADVVGIVFPVYHGGIPVIIRTFAGKLGNLKNKYIFAVCTYGDSPGIANEYLGKIIRLRGGELAAGFAVNMPYNYIIPSLRLKKFAISVLLREIGQEKQRKLFSNWPIKLADIFEYVNSRKTGLCETKSGIFIHLVDFLGLRNTIGKYLWMKIAGYDGRAEHSFWECLRLMDAGFRCDEKCNGCGTCSRICPVENITMTNDKPAWRHRCEQCFACLQWCPQSAIQFGESTSLGKRYHHPDVKISDMLQQASNT
jgi:ferredoxin/flavodoxin